MLPSHQGAFRLFRLAGVDVFLHWSWFLVALLAVRTSIGHYSSPLWNAAEYVALFLIVTLHEFGHALACRQVGGRADQIVLWPLGGVAYVDPPQRPGATLWSIAAGPLVNVALVPVLYGLHSLAQASSMTPDLVALLRAGVVINRGLLIFNLLPIYPLDGGQILRSLLWFVLGRARSLTVASAFGFVGVLGLALLAYLAKSTWIGLIAVFVGMNCWSGFQHARALARVAKLPRHRGFACPSCHAAPPIGAYWSCGACGTPFDTFETNAACPQCRAQFPVTSCVDCGVPSPNADWAAAVRP